MRARPIEERFWSKVDKRGQDECWPWTAASMPGGYGCIGVAGKILRSHRVSWTMANGDIPDGMFVCHRCDNPPCCNPAHLFLGTSYDNMRDRKEKARGNHPKGKVHYAARLTEGQVLEIIRLKGELSLTKTAKMFGIAKSHVCHIRTGRKWKHLQGGDGGN